MFEEGAEEKTVMEPSFREVETIIKRIRNGKAPGRDGIYGEMLKNAGEKLRQEKFKPKKDETTFVLHNGGDKS